jgi:hypothetical protein
MQKLRIRSVILLSGGNHSIYRKTFAGLAPLLGFEAEQGTL